MATVQVANQPSQVEHQRYVQRPCHPDRLAALREFAGRSILDAGCGNGQYIFALADEYDIHGVDCDDYPQWKQMSERFSVQDVCKLPHEADSFDTICCFEVLEHIPEPQRVMADFFRICRKNVIFTVPNCEVSPGMQASNLVHSHWTDPTHINFFKLQEAADLCRQAGFRVVKSELVNRMRIMNFVDEAFHLQGPLGRLVRAALRRSQRRHYDLTCLVVGEKC